MYYSLIGFLAALILMIENHDIIFRRKKNLKVSSMRIYQLFLYGVLSYYITDFLWGILYSRHLISLLFADTTVYYIAMAAGIFFWTQYVITYLGENNRFSRFLHYSGYVFFSGVVALAVINIFKRVLFWFDENGVYRTCPPRHISLVLQVVFFLCTSAYALNSIIRKNKASKNRYRTIALFGLSMSLLLAFQLFYPFLPLYSIGYLLGTCLLHTFVVNDEKEDYKNSLERALEKEILQQEELKATWKLAYTDALTGVKSKLAFSEMVERKDTEILDAKSDEFAVAVFDLNELKSINDREGHEKGDQFIISACRLICGYFKHSPVYRIGGDEFAVILEGPDYVRRTELRDSFNQMMKTKKEEDQLIIAMGISDYVTGEDKSFHQVFKRADAEMYKQKQQLKKRGKR